MALPYSLEASVVGGQEVFIPTGTLWALKLVLTLRRTLVNGLCHFWRSEIAEQVLSTLTGRFSQSARSNMLSENVITFPVLSNAKCREML